MAGKAPEPAHQDAAGIDRLARHRDSALMMRALSENSGLDLYLIDHTGRILLPRDRPPESVCTRFRSTPEGKHRCEASRCESPSDQVHIGLCHAGIGFAVSPMSGTGGARAWLAAHPAGLQAQWTESAAESLRGRMKSAAEISRLFFQNLQKVRELSQEILIGYEEKEIASEMGTLAVSSAEMDSLARQSVAKLSALTGAQRGVLYLQSETPGSFRLAGSVGESSPAPRPDLREGCGLTGSVIRTRTAQLFDHVETGEAAQYRLHEPHLRGAVLSVPLKVGEDVFGAVTLSEKANGTAFTTMDLKLVSSLSMQVALAIKNARLVGDLVAKEVERQKIKGIFGRYLAPQIVEALVRHGDPAQFPVQRETVTILFADIRGFTSLSEGESPEFIAEFLNDYFAMAARIIFKYEGTIDKFIGDCVMAIFGAPIKHDPAAGPSDAERAVSSAVELRDSFHALREKWRPRSARMEHSGIGIGLNTGPVVVGNIGSDARMDYTVIGDAVNLASRLCGFAPRGRIIISQGTRDSLREAVRVKELEPIEVKGKTGQFNIYEILDA